MREIIQNQRKERDELLSRPYITRHTHHDDETLLSSPMIKLITGPRRVGKSTQALLMLKGRNFAYLNFDDNSLLAAWDENKVMRTLDEIYPGYEFMMLDEVQNLDKWDVWVSTLYRRGKNLVITGSNAKMLSSEMATMLTGRYLQVEMMPFSLAEFREWHHSGNDGKGIAASTDTEALTNDYLRNGGYPETLAARSITGSYLGTLFDSIIWKDVAHRHRVRNITELSDMAAYLLANLCNPLSANSIADALSMTSVSTVKKYMGYLHEPYLFFYLPRYNNKMKIMQKAPQKVYVVDNGFVTSKAFSTSENLGRMLENHVFTELLRRGYDTERTLFYYRSRNYKETDFVLRQGNHVECLVQVCYDMSSPKTEKREANSITECAEELGCDNLVIVTRDEEKTIQEKGYTIKVVPIDKF